MAGKGLTRRQFGVGGLVATTPGVEQTRCI